MIGKCVLGSHNEQGERWIQWCTDTENIHNICRCGKTQEKTA